MNLIGCFPRSADWDFFYAIFSAGLLSDSQSSVHFVWARNLQFLGELLLLGHRFELKKYTILDGFCSF